jgi:hypothetical protein
MHKYWNDPMASGQGCQRIRSDRYVSSIQIRILCTREETHTAAVRVQFCARSHTHADSGCPRFVNTREKNVTCALNYEDTTK